MFGEIACSLLEPGWHGCPQGWAQLGAAERPTDRWGVGPLFSRQAGMIPQSTVVDMCGRSCGISVRKNNPLL